MNDINIVGVSHVSKESKELIKKEFANFLPDIVAVELDKRRYFGLKNDQKQKMSLGLIRTVGITGFLFALIGKLVQNKIGKIMKIVPGEEMLFGVNLAHNNKLKAALIDQDITITLKNINKIPLKEKMKIFFDVLKSPFSKQKIKFDVSKIPKEELIKTIILQLDKNYPNLSKAILHDRNKYMAKKLFLIKNQNPQAKILAIVGAAHKEGMVKELKSLFESNISRNA